MFHTSMPLHTIFPMPFPLCSAGSYNSIKVSSEASS